MSILQLAENVHWVGVRDPHLRVFDLIMETRRGTTYNSYLIRGEKTALIDTVKAEFTADFFRKIESLISVDEIDYLIVNHTEPDHSGAMAELLARNPFIQIYCSGAAVPFVKACLNKDYPITAVKDDFTLDLGNKKLIFKILPYMHWPDTMMEYLVEDKILFSCDGFAAHLDSETMIADESSTQFGFEYHNYFDAIMRPFTGYIRRNLPKLDEFDIRMIAPSHGPFVTENPRFWIERYTEWCADKTLGLPRVTVFYASNYGNTKIISEAVARQLTAMGIVSQAVDITLCHADHARDLIESSAGIIVGTPTFNGDAPKPVWDLVGLISTVYALGKKAAVIGSYGWGGEGVKLVADRLAGLKLKVMPDPVKVRMVPSDAELTAVKAFCEQFAHFIREGETVKVS